jgi:hypothetical protein
MRTIFLVCLVALVVAVGMALAVGVVECNVEHPAGKYIVTVTVNTNLIHAPLLAGSHSLAPAADQELVDVNGTITTVRPDRNEFVVSENVKNWTFQLAKNGKVFVNDREAKLADLQAGDRAVVSFDRDEDVLLARVVRSTRK